MHPSTCRVLTPAHPQPQLRRAPAPPCPHTTCVGGMLSLCRLPPLLTPCPARCRPAEALQRELEEARMAAGQARESRSGELTEVSRGTGSSSGDSPSNSDSAAANPSAGAGTCRDAAGAGGVADPPAVPAAAAPAGAPGAQAAGSAPAALAALRAPAGRGGPQGAPSYQLVGVAGCKALRWEVLDQGGRASCCAVLCCVILCCAGMRIMLWVGTGLESATCVT